MKDTKDLITKVKLIELQEINNKNKEQGRKSYDDNYLKQMRNHLHYVINLDANDTFLMLTMLEIKTNNVREHQLWGSHTGIYSLESPRGGVLACSK